MGEYLVFTCVKKCRFCRCLLNFNPNGSYVLVTSGEPQMSVRCFSGLISKLSVCDFFFFNQSSRLVREHAESVLKTEREIWAREKMESQQALRAAQVEQSRLREELNKDAATRIPVSGHESDSDEITWPRAKVSLQCNVVELETSLRKYCLQ